MQATPTNEKRWAQKMHSRKLRLVEQMWNSSEDNHKIESTVSTTVRLAVKDDGRENEACNSPAFDNWLNQYRTRLAMVVRIGAQEPDDE